MKSKRKNPFNGCTIVVTGKLADFTRAGINEKITSLGAKAGSSVTGRTDYLIIYQTAGRNLYSREVRFTKLSMQFLFSYASYRIRIC